MTPAVILASQPRLLVESVTLLVESVTPAVILASQPRLLVESVTPAAILAIIHAYLLNL